ncbi:threonine-phosphate decarboxylase [Alkalicoccus urumqiensis]|uniref:Aminotransferase n=1 Tax=Alkalicoccus urumqiensis TaxID=1548213 RepID=A0A2P6MIA8_ALKUR|nr:threonine-phosphate decarboxylase [Alkalicoccus urumqiensis]PRO66000.1 threonine-phosphate decarboxylase [Alkalicoccus urumqiensis]
MNWPVHGGHPELLEGAPDTVMIDFSANLNPLGPPSWLMDRAEAALPQMLRYPDPDYASSRKGYAESEHVAASQVLLTNGGAEAIQLAALLHRGGQAAVAVPAFAEYETACTAAGITVTRLPYEGGTFPLDEACARMAEWDLFFLCRPHNPSGTVLEAGAVRQLADACETAGTMLIIDEAFVDFLPSEEKLTPLLNTHSSVVLLRSFTKMFVIPGLRLGCVLASEHVTAQLKALQPAWSVNAVAAALLPDMAADTSFVRESVALVEKERERVFQSLPDRFSVSASRVNFYLIRDTNLDDQKPLFQFLLQEGAALRHTYNFEGINGSMLRAAVRTPEENDVLIQALQKWDARC